MKIWVVCTNDYPDAVFSTEAAAEAYAYAGNAEQKRQREGGGIRGMSTGMGRIRYHVHSFELDK